MLHVKLRGNFMSFEKKEQVDQLQRKLQVLLKQEVECSQSILSQLDQEEYMLLIGEVGMEKEINLEVETLSRDQILLTRQKQVIEEKIQVLCQISEIAEILDPLQERDAEIVILIEKERMLKEKILERKNHLECLRKLIKGEKLDPRELKMQIKTICDKKNQKPLLITIDMPNDEEAQN